MQSKELMKLLEDTYQNLPSQHPDIAGSYIVHVVFILYYYMSKK